MKIIQATIYECEYCRKYYKRRHFAERHELQCRENPNNQHICYDCEHLEVGREHLSDEVSVKTFRCSVKDIYMHTCKAEARKMGVVKDTERMPLECELYVSGTVLFEE